MHVYDGLSLSELMTLQLTDVTIAQFIQFIPTRFGFWLHSTTYARGQNSYIDTLRLQFIVHLAGINLTFRGANWFYPSASPYTN